jgi:hypothetical protein
MGSSAIRILGIGIAISFGILVFWLTAAEEGGDGVQERQQ